MSSTLVRMLFLLTIFFSGCQKSEVLKFHSIKFDFKKIKPGDVVTAIYPVQNNSNDDVFIEDISSECDCIVPLKRKMKIPIGTSEKIMVKFEPQKGTTGIQEREIIVRVNKTPYFYHLKMTGTVVAN